MTQCLSPVRLELRQRLEVAHRPITKVYFPLRGIVSNRRHESEIGLIGYEGMTGSAMVLGAKTSPSNAFVRMEGDGLCLGAGDLIRLLDESLSLRCALLRYIHVSVQTAQTALANSRGNITNRLPRCLLMVHDRAAGHELRLTHEFFRSCWMSDGRAWVLPQMTWTRGV